MVIDARRWEDLHSSQILDFWVMQMVLVQGKMVRTTIFCIFAKLKPLWV